MKVGIIGLGDIALKAYLPVLAYNENLHLHLFTRNQEVLHNVGKQYHIQNIYYSIELLLQSGIKAAFVHVATVAHYEIVQQLLQNNIHVYVDKPLTYDQQSSEYLLDLAEEKNLILMAGFNRRYAPAYENLKEVKAPNMVLMQKNRKSLPGEVRNFIFDDFIHVVDTLLYLFPHAVDEIKVQGKKLENNLYHVTVQLISKNGAIAIGIMNRDAGTTEEKVEVYSPSEKRVAYDVADVAILKDNKKVYLKRNDWEPTLHKRGFYQITDDFIKSVSMKNHPKISSKDIRITHGICERIVQELEVQN